MPAASESLQRAQAALLGPFSLIRSCKTVLAGAGEPRLHAVTAVPNRTALYLGFETQSDTGAIGFSHGDARNAAIGETIERYCGSYCNRDGLIYGSKHDLGDDAIGFDEFAVHADAQYGRSGWPFARWDPALPISWAEGRSLVTGRRRLVPACLVYVPFVPSDPSEPALTLSVSSGHACHTDYERAVLTGLFEVVERDAFMISWLRKLPLPRIDFMADPEVAAVYERHFAGCGLQFDVFDMTLDLAIPSYLCLVQGMGERGPFLGMGAATRLRHRDAVIKALLEAAQVQIWCRDLIVRKRDWRPAPGWSNIVDFEDHVRLWCEPSMRPHAAFLLDTPHRRAPVTTWDDRLDRPADAVARCLQLIEALGHDCVVVDMTAPEIRAAGFVAPKVFIPGLVPLTSVHWLQALGSPRLWTVPVARGFADQIGAELNPIPHPFP